VSAQADETLTWVTMLDALEASHDRLMAERWALMTDEEKEQAFLLDIINTTIRH
jgi:hypothetical protein